MRNVRGGYTIIEVLIVLAVSSVIFIAAVTLFSGKQQRTEFSQAMHDIDSEFQSIVNDVGTGVFPNSSNYNCKTQPPLTGRPQLSSTTAGTGTNEDCVFLGKAVLIDNKSDPNNLLIYTVLGNRTDSTGDPITTFSASNFLSVSPTPMMGPSPSPDLTETYELPFGATVLSAHEDTAPNQETDLMGFYNSQQSASNQGSLSLLTLGYVGFKTKNSVDPPGQIKTSIQSNNPNGGVVSKAWTLCFQSGGSNQTAVLTVSSSAAGLTTKIDFNSCT